MHAQSRQRSRAALRTPASESSSLATTAAACCASAAASSLPSVSTAASARGDLGVLELGDDGGRVLRERRRLELA